MDDKKDILNLMLKSFPSYLENDIKIISDKIYFNSRINDEPRTFPVVVKDEIITIPEQIYYDEPDELEINQLTNFQKEILNCFYTRHHNGYIREAKLKSIITSNQNWIVPYVIKLVGEYIIEILDVIYNNIKTIDVEHYKIFLINNQKFFKTTESRVGSYWDCYYRIKFSDKKDYVGFKLIKHFQELIKK